MLNCIPKATPMETNLKIEENTYVDRETTKPYRELIGSLSYLANMSRDQIIILFAVNYLLILR